MDIIINSKCKHASEHSLIFASIDISNSVYMKLESSKLIASSYVSAGFTQSQTVVNYCFYFRFIEKVLQFNNVCTDITESHCNHNSLLFSSTSLLFDLFVFFL